MYQSQLLEQFQPFATAVRDAYVDRDARKGKAPSDHAPVVVDVAAGDLRRRRRGP
ncbi:MAG TPA: hypothetical protein VET24_15230 [Actinomycetota bacterium]|nr:hypothetical protein [Actinomycetota bacterium]